MTAPRSGRQIVLEAVVVAAVVWFGCAGGAVGFWWAIRLLGTRRRMAQWSREWAALNHRPGQSAR